MVLENMPLVTFALHKYVHAPPHMREDLQQEGYLALCKAILAYDGTKSAFSTFAVPCIAQAMQKYILRNVSIIRLPFDSCKSGNTPYVVSSIDRELTEEGATLQDVIDDPDALEEIHAWVLEREIMREATNILDGYKQHIADMCFEDLKSRIAGKQPRQKYLMDKYGLSRQHVYTELRKFYQELKQRVT